ncbi:MAG: hypothetical protein ACI8QS_001516 [Planctomycetota bacterium]|jgi:hypothetical protein
MASLLKALAIAFVISGVLLILVVLPAERNIDITGFGHAVGLTALSAPPAGGTEQLPAEDSTAVETKADEQIVIEVPPDSGLEYKFYVLAGEKLKFEWSTDTGELFYDFHGEPKGAAKNVFESFAAGTASGAKGTLTTPFEGTHGWYWRNKSTETIKVTLVTSGTYEVLGLR